MWRIYREDDVYPKSLCVHPWQRNSVSQDRRNVPCSFISDPLILLARNPDETLAALPRMAIRNREASKHLRSDTYIKRVDDTNHISKSRSTVSWLGEVVLEAVGRAVPNPDRTTTSSQIFKKETIVPETLGTKQSSS